MYNGNEIKDGNATLRDRLQIPKSQSDVVFQLVITAVIVVFALLAIINLCNGAAVIPSAIWLVFVIVILWLGSRDAGGLRKFLLAQLEGLFGQPFIERDDIQPQMVHLGFQLFGEDYIEHFICIDDIETVEWATGQASALAGRDVNDWHVTLWFDHHDQLRADTQRKWHRKPEQDLHILGPSRQRELTEVFGRSIVDFLRKAGAELVEASPTSFVRQKKAEMSSSPPALPRVSDNV